MSEGPDRRTVGAGSDQEDVADGDVAESETADVQRAFSQAQTLAENESSARGGAEPDRIGPYFLLEPLGEGGMGTVWLAEQREPVRREVALKVIKLGMDTREVISRFQGERQALAMMNHSAIARVLDAGQTEHGSPYFVMEYVPGKPITDYCDRKTLTVRERLELFVDVCGAVQHAHQKGILHRDLKPSNVLVSDHEGRPLPKIIDFGLAKAMEHRLTDATQTRHGAILGTPAYMSPEQVDPLSVDIDTRADIYSLGVMLYELLVGGLPFPEDRLRGAGLVELQEMIRSEEPPGLTKRLSTLGNSLTTTAARRHVEPALLANQLRGDLEWIVSKAMDKDRERRYSSAAELAEDIDRHLHDEPVRARPASAAYRLGKFARRRKGLVMAATAVVVALMGGLATTTAMYLRAEERRLEAERDRALAEGLNDYFNVDIFLAAAQLDDGAGVGAVFDLAAAKIEGRFPDRPVTEARFRGNLAVFYERNDDLDAAAEQLRVALSLTDDPEDCGEGRGTDCTEWAAWGRRTLGRVVAAQGNLAEARRLQELAVADHRRIVGADHSATLSAVAELVFTRIRQGELAAGRALQEELVAASNRARGPDDGWSLRRTAYLGEIMRRQDDLPAARDLLQRVLPDVEATFGAEHGATIATRWSLVETLRQQGHAQEAAEVAASLCWLTARDADSLSASQRAIRTDLLGRCATS